MTTIALVCEDGPAVIAVPGATVLPCRGDRADHREQLEQHPPDQFVVTLHLTEDMLSRSYNRAHWHLGMLLPLNYARSDQEQPHPQLRRHQPHQTPSERLFQRPFIECLLLWRAQ